MRQDSARICRGPKRAPGRFEVPMSNGTPTKQASSPAALGRLGRRIIVAGPPKRGIWLPPSGWCRVLLMGRLALDRLIPPQPAGAVKPRLERQQGHPHGDQGDAEPL